MDGHPRFAIAPGQRYAYEFTVSNRAGRYWFHPPANGQTGAQVYFGLAGLFLVGDDEEAALRLPSGRYDVPLVLQDRTCNDDNQFIYLESGLRDGAATDNPHRSPMMGARSDGRWYGWWDAGPRDDAGGMGSMMPRMMRVLGDEILVNGRSEASLRVERRPYRLRLLNGSNRAPSSLPGTMARRSS